MIYLHAYIDTEYTVYIYTQYQYVPSLPFPKYSYPSCQCIGWHVVYCEYTEIFISSSSISITERFIGSIRLREMLIYILFFIIPISNRIDVLTYIYFYSFIFPMTAWSLWLYGKQHFQYFHCVHALRWFFFFTSFVSLVVFVAVVVSFISPECVIYLNNVDVCASICFKYFFTHNFSTFGIRNVFYYNHFDTTLSLLNYVDSNSISHFWIDDNNLNCSFHSKKKGFHWSLSKFEFDFCCFFRKNTAPITTLWIIVGLVNNRISRFI